MIEQLTEHWDDALYNSFRWSGPGINNCGLNGILRHTVNDMVNECCDIINENKQTAIKAEYVDAICNIEKLSVYVLYKIRDVIMANANNISFSNCVKIKFELPRSREFNENPKGFYQKIIQEIWSGYKLYKEHKYSSCW